jgi:phosphonate transport system permease protein
MSVVLASRPSPRFDRPNPIAFILWVLTVAFVVWSFSTTGLSLERLARGIPAIGGILERMFPPNLDRLDRILASLLVTFQMAVAGCTLGLILSFPLAMVAADGISPLVRIAARWLIALFRTVPDLVWALLFVIAVGLGPAAGVLALMVDTMGFAARFFAEAMEETDRGPREALAALGARPLGVVMSAVIPDATPSFIATSLFCVEKATRASVVLGLVGAGGIGIELKVAFDLFDYSTAATIILAILVLVIVVEQAGGMLRRRII